MISGVASSSANLRPDASSASHGKALTPEQQRQIQQLKEIDRKVRAHEQAHLAVGGDLVRGGATYTYQTGPDEKRYAVGGEVSIDASPGRTPEETVPKAQHIRATALAPADPSPQDRSVAAKASTMEAEARGELAAQRISDDEQGGAIRSAQDRSPSGFYQAIAQVNDFGFSPGASLDAFA